MATATYHDGRQSNASPNSAAPVPGRASALRAHASLDDGAALLPAARCSAIDHVVHGAADHPRAWAPLRCTGVLPCPAPQRAVHSATRPHCARLWRTVSSLACLRWRGGRHETETPRCRAPTGAPERRVVCSGAVALQSARHAPERPCSRAPELQSARAPERPCSRLHGRVRVVMGAASQTAAPLAAHRVVSAAATIRHQRTRECT
jgi:hypothetical protein